MKGIVYKIYCKDSSITEFYIGSSVDFKTRKRKHKSDCNNTNSAKYNYKVYKFIRENGGWDNWEFETLLEVEVVDKEELRLKYERPYQLDLLPELNSQLEGRTIEEWREDNKEELAKYQKEYQKEYREDHKEEIKQYFEKNKEQILQKAKEKIICECGSVYRRSNKSKHQKTKIHQDFIL
jgi:flagellar biosynthesis/type III secretory pathway protein FliH